MPGGYKAEKVFCSKKISNIWVTARGSDKRLLTFAVGSSPEYLGTNLAAKEDKLEQVNLPIRTYLTKVG